MKNRNQKGLPLETKSAQNLTNRRLELIESLHIQHCSLRAAYAPNSAGFSGI